MKKRNTIFLIARDRAAKMMLLGGLGLSVPVGEMWYLERDNPRWPDPAERFDNWESAPEVTCPEHLRKCLSECPPAFWPAWFGNKTPYGQWPRCWGTAGHLGDHYVGEKESDRRVEWKEVGIA